MEKNSGKRLQAVRDHNIKVVYNNLLEKPMSGNELAAKIGISATSVGKIIKEMLSLGIVKIFSDNQKTKHVGRQHERYVIKGEKIYIVGINLTYMDEFYFICDMAGAMCFKQKLEFAYPIHKKDFDFLLNDVEKTIKEILPDDAEYVFVLSIPGQVSKDTNVLLASSRMESLIDTNFSQIFYERFGKLSCVDNDVNYMLRGNMLQQMSNYSVFCFVEYGIALSVFCNGSIIMGYRGYAGEIGKNVVDGKLLKTVTTINYFLEEGKKIKPDLIPEGIVELYNNSAEFKAIILRSAEYLAQALCNFGNIFAFQSISFGGIITEFGDDYFDVIQQYFKKYSSVPVRLVCCSNVKPEKGMIKNAQDIIIDNILASRTE